MNITENKTAPIETSLVQQGGARGRYDNLKLDRSPYETRARECAKLTLPMVFREEGANASTNVETPWQGLGSRGVKTLSAKMLLAVLPPNSPFWRYFLSDASIAKLGQDPSAKAKLESGLSKIERGVQEFIETNAYRPKVAEVLTQLIITGNALIYVTPEGQLRVFKLNSYVVNRDPVGNWLEIVTHEKVSPSTLSPDVKLLLGQAESTKKTVDIYTWIRRQDNQYVVHQEIGGVVIPQSQGTYPLDACPWVPLRFYAEDGESYGRSYVEEHLGDLTTLEILAQSAADTAVAISRNVYGAKRGGTVNVKELQNARNGDVIQGDLENDLTQLRSTKGGDLQVVLAASERNERRLEQAFLMNGTVARNAERVTAEEVRYLAQELEDTLGGIYSVLAQEFQLPLLRAILAVMTRRGEMPKLPDGIAKPVIVTGLGALGRGQDLDKLSRFLVAMQPFGGEALRVINMDNYATRVANALGIDTRGLVKTPDELQAEKQAEQEAQMAQQVAPQAMNAALSNPEVAQQAVAQVQ